MGPVAPVEDAAPIAIAAYLGAYGPTSSDSFGKWIGSGRISKRTVRSWFGSLGHRLAEVRVDGEPLFVLAADLDELLETRPSRVVRLLPGFDQFVMGPGTADGHVTPAARRSAVSRQSGWISPVVLDGGVARGTWQLDGDRVTVTWFPEGGRVARAALQAEVARLGAIAGRELGLAVTVAQRLPTGPPPRA